MLLLLALFIISLFNYKLCKDARYPAFIFSSLWLVVMSIYYWGPIPIDPISTDTEVVILIAVCAFSLSGLPVVLGAKGKLQLLKKFSQIGSNRPDSFRRPTVNKMLFYLSLALFPLLFAKARELSALSSSDVFLVGLRVKLAGEFPPGFGILGNCLLLSFFTTFVLACSVRDWSKANWYFYLSLATSLAYGVLSTGRTPLFMLVIVLGGISVMKRQVRVRIMVWVSLACLVFFTVFAIIMGKGGNEYLSRTENLNGITESFFVYLIGPIPALDFVVSRTNSFDYGQNTFSGLLNIIYKFEGKDLIPAIQRYVAIPFFINVYTAIQPLYKDFGIWGVGFGFLLVGLVTNYLYLRAAHGSNLYIYLYSLSLFPLFVSTFTDQYFAPMSGWIKFAVAGYLYYGSAIFRSNLKIKKAFKESLPET